MENKYFDQHSSLVSMFTTQKYCFVVPQVFWSFHLRQMKVSFTSCLEPSKQSQIYWSICGETVWKVKKRRLVGFTKSVEDHYVIGIFFSYFVVKPIIFLQQLLYFSAHPYTQEGFLRALSVASGHHMPRLGKLDPRPPSVTERLVLIKKIVFKF